MEHDFAARRDWRDEDRKNRKERGVLMVVIVFFVAVVLYLGLKGENGYTFLKFLQQPVPTTGTKKASAPAPAFYVCA